MRLLGWLISFPLLAGRANSWCQPDDGSCVGKLHRFEKRPPTVAMPCFQENHPRMQLADWDGDGDVDVLVGESISSAQYDSETRVRKLVDIRHILVNPQLGLIWDNFSFPILSSNSLRDCGNRHVVKPS